MNNSVLLGINERANKHYRSSYNGASDGKGSLATDMVNLCGKFPGLSEEVNLYPLSDVLGAELAQVVTQGISGIKYVDSNVDQNSVQMNR